MIHDLSLTLKAILDDPALAVPFYELAEAQIVFDRPIEGFNPAQPTIDLFLYDIRENMELRSNEPKYKRLDGKTRIHRPPMRVSCSYLVTAWPAGEGDLALQEHQLLSQALQVLSRHPKIPAEFLRGQLQAQKPPLPMMTAQTDGPRDPAEFWTAIGNKLRPSITVTVTIGMEIFQPKDPDPFTVTTAVVHVGERVGPDEDEISLPTRLTSFWIGGRVTGANDAPEPGAMAALVGTGLAARTDADGRFTLGSVPEGSYTLRVQSDAATRDVRIEVPAPSGSNYNVRL